MLCQKRQQINIWLVMNWSNEIYVWRHLQKWTATNRWLVAICKHICLQASKIFFFLLLLYQIVDWNKNDIESCSNSTKNNIQLTFSLSEFWLILSINDKPGETDRFEFDWVSIKNSTRWLPVPGDGVRFVFVIVLVAAAIESISAEIISNSKT